MHTKHFFYLVATLALILVSDSPEEFFRGRVSAFYTGSAGGYIFLSCIIGCGNIAFIGIA